MTPERELVLEAQVRQLQDKVVSLIKKVEELEQAFERTRANVKSIPLHGSVR